MISQLPSKQLIAKMETEPMKGDQENKQESLLNSNQIADMIVNGSYGQIAVALQAFKELKHRNYASFEKKIFHNLQRSTITLRSSLLSFSDIQETVQKDVHLTSQTQLQSIFNGYAYFWEVCSFEWKTFEQQFLNYIQKIHIWLVYPFTSFCKKVAMQRFSSMESEVEKIIVRIIESILNQDAKSHQRIPAIIHIFSLQKNFPQDTLANIMLSIDSPKHDYFYKGQNQKLLNQILTLVIKSLVKWDEKRAVSLVKKFELDTAQFPELIKLAQKKSLSYLLKTHKIEFLELLLKNRGDIFLAFIRKLYSNRNTLDYAINFSKRYQIPIQDYIIQKENSQMLINNILLEKDAFMPTQVAVYGFNAKRYIHLSDWGINEGQVYYLNNENFYNPENSKKLRNLFGLKIGLDCQSVVSITPFDTDLLALLQISNQSEIYIFDLLKLKNSEPFKDYIQQLMRSSTFVGHGVKMDLKALSSFLKISIDEYNIVDTMELFKHHYKRQTKCSLGYVCQKIFKKELSKFEQCSGWDNRPLRKTQLHYAALDAFVCLKLMQHIGHQKYS